MCVCVRARPKAMHTLKPYEPFSFEQQLRYAALYYQHDETYLRHNMHRTIIYRNKHFDSYLIMGCEMEECDRDLVDSFKSTHPIQNNGNHSQC